MEFFTIGVYNSTEQEFFNKLKENRIDTFCDIRQRRGVRGSKYTFVNSNKLQEKLTALDIKYGHIIELAPTTDIRDLQKEVDLQNGELKSERQVLGKLFTIEYKNKVLNKFDFESLIENLEDLGASRIALFCIEENPDACHRSLVTKKLQDLNFKVSHI